jgi:cyclic pyranopterin phosphate synthase
VNVVVVKGLNDQEINDFIAWTRHTPVDVRFIEFMPFTGNRWSSDKVMTLKEIQGVIASQYDFAPVPSEPHDTAKKFAIAGHAGTFAVISTMSAHFCGDCNRIRLTADGKLKNCLFSKTETDLLSALRQGEDVIPLIHKSIQAKERALGGQLIPDFEDLHADQIKNRTMISIGG